jgi:hypothetical protein
MIAFRMRSRSAAFAAERTSPSQTVNGRLSRQGRFNGARGFDCSWIFLISKPFLHLFQAEVRRCIHCPEQVSRPRLWAPPCTRKPPALANHAVFQTANFENTPPRGILSLGQFDRFSCQKLGVNLSCSRGQQNLIVWQGQISGLH